MRNFTTTALSAKYSSKVQRRRKLYQVRKSVLINPLNFARQHRASLTMKYENGLYYFGLSSEGIKPHAWGSSFQEAYKNLLRNFYEKLEWLNSKNVA